MEDMLGWSDPAEDISGCRDTPSGGYIREKYALLRIYQTEDILPVEDISGRDTPYGGYIRLGSINIRVPVAGL